MEIKHEIIYDSGTSDFCFSLRKQKYIEIESQKVDVGQPERLAVCPGDFEAVEVFAPELLPIMQGFWTQEIIGSYRAKVEAVTNFTTE